MFYQMICLFGEIEYCVVIKLYGVDVVSDDVTFELTIPLDEDGYIELECDFCRTRFMITADDFKHRDMPHLFCPICGMPNDINKFYCPEVLEKGKQMVTEWARAEIQKQLGGAIRNMNRSGFLKMDLKIPNREPEKELYRPLNEYSKTILGCCDMEIKVREIDKQIGAYCPICGCSYI